MTGFLVQSTEDEEIRLTSTLDKILNIAEIISLDKEIIITAYNERKSKSLGIQDSIVYASFVKHLKVMKVQNNCLINKNSSDFDDPDIINELKQHDCKVLFKFKDGLGYIKSELNLN